MTEEQNQKLARELRQRLNNLQLGIQRISPLLMEQGSEKASAYLAMLNQNLYSMMRTVSHLELTSGALPACRPVTLDLAGLCRKLARELEGLSAAAGVTFLYESREVSLLADADEDLLEQAILNLVANAIEAARRGGGHVWLKLARLDRQAVLTVRDDGPGFPDPEQASSDSFVKQPGGLGLGLETARRIAELHGGRLLCRSTEPAGGQAILSLGLHTHDDTVVRSPQMGYERSGGFSPLLVALADVLPTDVFAPADLED